MKLTEYLAIPGKTERGLAAALDVSPGLVWQWKRGITRITAERALEIEATTDGLVSRSDCRPDLWPKTSERAA